MNGVWRRLFLVLSFSAMAWGEDSLYPQSDIVLLVNQSTLQLKSVGFVTGDIESHLKRIDRHLDSAGLKSLRDNHFIFLSLTETDFFHCASADRSLSLTAERVLSDFEQILSRGASEQGLRESDPHALALFLSASYLGRCGHEREIERLRTLYRQIDRLSDERAAGQILFYPTPVGFYSDGDLHLAAKHRYLFALRTGLVWDAYRKERALATEFDVAPDRLNASMRPGGLSEKGFLGSDETYAEVVENDRKYLARYQWEGSPLSPRRLGKTLFSLLQTFHQSLRQPVSPLQTPETFKNEVKFRAHRYAIECDTSAARWQVSPFKDGLQGLCDYKIRNLDSGLDMYIAGIVPPLIAVREFFEGKGTPYRVDPSTLVKLLE